MDENKRLKVLTPIEGKDKKTYWRSLGVGFVNKDKSLNLYLEALPVNGKLHVREWDDNPSERRSEQLSMKPLGNARSVPPPNDDLPF